MPSVLLRVTPKQNLHRIRFHEYEKLGECDQEGLQSFDGSQEHVHNNNKLTQNHDSTGNPNSFNILSAQEKT